MLNQPEINTNQLVEAELVKLKNIIQSPNKKRSTFNDEFVDTVNKMLLLFAELREKEPYIHRSIFCIDREHSLSQSLINIMNIIFQKTGGSGIGDSGMYKYDVIFQPGNRGGYNTNSLKVNLPSPEGRSLYLAMNWSDYTNYTPGEKNSTIIDNTTASLRLYHLGKTYKAFHDGRLIINHLSILVSDSPSISTTTW